MESCIATRDNYMIFQCARCGGFFKEVEGDQQEAISQASKDFDLSFRALAKAGGLQKVCISCYDAVMNQGTNTPKQTNGNPTYRILDSDKKV